MQVSRTRLILTVLLFLVAIELVLVLVHFVSHFGPRPLHHLQLWFDLDRESSIAVWFSASQLMLSGLLLLLAAWLRWHDRSDRVLLATGGLGFLFLSADEVAQVHERVTYFTVNYDIVPRFPDDHGVWIFLYGAIGLVLVLVLFPHILRFLRRDTLPALLIGGGFGAIVLGGVGVEMTMYYETWTGPGQVAMEEALEMLGGSLILCGTLVLIAPMIAFIPQARATPDRPPSADAPARARPADEP